MTPIQPEVEQLTGRSVTDRYPLWERSRFEWRLGEQGDPAQLVNDYLASYGLGLSGQRWPLSEGVVGATLFISAAGGAAMVGAPTGRPSPCVAVPDVVAIVHERGHETVPEVSTAFPDPSWWLGEWAPSWSPGRHADAVSAVRDAIARGDVYQVNLVGHASAPYLGDPLRALRRVPMLAGASFGGMVSGAGWALASASPELLVQVRGGVVETRPIKGTRPATAAGQRELLSSAKERAEHVMIVDLERNDLAQVAQVGTVTVPELFAIRRWCDLWQAESRVTARLRSGVDLAGLLRAVCPGGSVTGAPKLAALEQIAALEPVGRGPSMGALGWLDADGTLTLGLTIRTVAADASRLHLWAGGGITWDSDPYAEVAEAAAKASPIKDLFA